MQTFIYVIIGLLIYVAILALILLFMAGCHENNEIYDKCYENDPLPVIDDDETTTDIKEIT